MRAGAAAVLPGIREAAARSLWVLLDCAVPASFSLIFNRPGKSGSRGDVSTPTMVGSRGWDACMPEWASVVAQEMLQEMSQE